MLSEKEVTEQQKGKRERGRERLREKREKESLNCRLSLGLWMVLLKAHWKNKKGSLSNVLAVTAKKRGPKPKNPIRFRIQKTLKSVDKFSQHKNFKIYDKMLQELFSRKVFLVCFDVSGEKIYENQNKGKQLFDARSQLLLFTTLRCSFIL